MAGLVDMSMDDEDILDHPMPLGGEKMRYPPGLRLCLCGPDMKKLQLEPGECNIGDYIDVRAFGEITHIDKDRVEIQIQRLKCENEEDEGEGEGY